MPDFRADWFDGTRVERFQNTNPLDGSSPVLTATPILNGRQIAGRYELTVQTRGPGTAGTFLIKDLFFGKNNPLHNLTRSGVFDDAVTPNKNILRGHDIRLASAAAVGHKAIVHSGAILGAAVAGNPAGLTYDQTDGYQSPGDTSGHGAAARFAVGVLKFTNVSGSLASDVRAVLRSAGHYDAITGAGLSYFDVVGFPDTPTSGPGGLPTPWDVTFGEADEDTGLVPVYFNGTGRSFTNTGSGAVVNSAIAGLLPGSTRYRCRAAQDLVDVDIKVDAAVTASDTGKARIWPRQFVELTPYDGADYVSRADGEYDEVPLWGTEDVLYNQVDDGDAIYLGVQGLVPAGGDYDQNPFEAMIRIQAAVGGSAFGS